MSASTSIVPVAGSIAATVTCVPLPTLRRQSSVTSGGGMRTVSTTPVKMPLSGAVSKIVMVSWSPSAVVSTTVRLSISFGLRLAPAALTSKNSGSPPCSCEAGITRAVAVPVAAARGATACLADALAT